MHKVDGCPVCHCALVPASGYRIPRHCDGVGHVCPTSGRDYRIVEAGAE